MTIVYYFILFCFVLCFSVSSFAVLWLLPLTERANIFLCFLLLFNIIFFVVLIFILFCFYFILPLVGMAVDLICFVLYFRVLLFNMFVAIKPTTKPTIPSIGSEQKLTLFLFHIVYFPVFFCIHGLSPTPHRWMADYFYNFSISLNTPSSSAMELYRFLNDSNSIIALFSSALYSSSCFTKKFVS